MTELSWLPLYRVLPLSDQWHFVNRPVLTMENMNGPKVCSDCECSTFKRRVLVTGGAGFIGSHVISRLVQRYPEYMVINLDKLEYCASEKHLEFLLKRPNYKFVHGDMCDVDFMRYLFQMERIDTVIHCAAQTHVDLSFSSSLEFTMANVFGTHVLVDTAAQANVRLFLHVSTDEVYGGESTKDLTENDPMRPTNPYAATKAAGEIIARSYFECFKFPVVVVRANNIYGPHQYPEKVIPKFISLLHRDRKCCIYGNGKEIRNFLFAHDVAEAFDVLMHKGVPGQIYNVASQFETTVIDLARTLIRKMKGVTSEEDINKYLEFVSDRPLNDFRYPLDNSKMQALGWEPRTNWEEGLQKTIDWFITPGNFESWEGGEEMLKPHAHGLLHSTRPHGFKPMAGLKSPGRPTKPTANGHCDHSSPA